MKLYELNEEMRTKKINELLNELRDAQSLDKLLDVQLSKPPKLLTEPFDLKELLLIKKHLESGSNIDKSRLDLTIDSLIAQVKVNTKNAFIKRVAFINRVLLRKFPNLIPSASSTSTQTPPWTIFAGEARVDVSTFLNAILDLLNEFSLPTHCFEAAFFLVVGLFDKEPKPRIKGVERGVEKNVELQLSLTSFFRLMIAATLTAIKMIDDHGLLNASYAKASGLEKKDINQLEIEFLKLTRFDLSQIKDLWVKVKEWIAEESPESKEILNFIYQELFHEKVGADQECNLMQMPQSVLIDPQQPTIHNDSNPGPASAAGCSYQHVILSLPSQPKPQQVKQQPLSPPDGDFVNLDCMEAEKPQKEHEHANNQESGQKTDARLSHNNRK